METKHAYTDGVIALSQEERLARSLLGTLPNGVPPAPLGAIDRVSRSKIRYGISELVALNIDNVNLWLQKIANGDELNRVPPNPRAAIELFVELLQFSVPKMKAVAVDMKSRDGSVQRLSLADLQTIVSDQ